MSLFEHNDFYDETIFTTMGYSSVATDIWRGQQFLALSNHVLSKVMVRIGQGSTPHVGHTGIVTLAVQNTDLGGLPTGPDLCYGTVDGDTLVGYSDTPHSQFVTFTINTP